MWNLAWVLSARGCNSFTGREPDMHLLSQIIIVFLEREFQQGYNLPSTSCTWRDKVGKHHAISQTLLTKGGWFVRDQCCSVVVIIFLLPVRDGTIVSSLGFRQNRRRYPSPSCSGGRDLYHFSCIFVPPRQRQKKRRVGSAPRLGWFIWKSLPNEILPLPDRGYKDM